MFDLANVTTGTEGRELKVYVGSQYDAICQLEVSLSDDSAPAVIQTNSVDTVYTITFNAVSEGQIFIIKHTTQISYGNAKVFAVSFFFTAC